MKSRPTVSSHTASFCGVSWQSVPSDCANESRALFLLLAVCATPPAFAEPVPADATGGVDERRSVLSLVELRDRGVVRQLRDYSCGAAALATLFVHQWGDSIDEEDVLTTLSKVVTREELASRRSSGLTLLDLSRIARARGYRASGYRLAPEQLAGLTGPVIVFIDPGGYEHFSVLKGIADGRAHLADPSHGNVSYPLHDFLDMWLRDDGVGIALAVVPLRSELTLLPAGELVMPAEQPTAAALANVRSRLPFSIDGSSTGAVVR